jgi:hypothetical protein
MTERRRWQRREVTWSVRFLVAEGTAVAGRALDASRHGLRLVLDRPGPAPELAHGQRCAVEVHLADNQARFFREAEVCRVDEHGIGLVIPQPLPVVLVPSVASGVPAADVREPRPHPVATRLRALALGVCRLVV